MSSSPRFAFCLLALTALLVGCAGYRMGTRTLYRQDIRTVHVPIIRSESFRPDIGVRLTEAVQKRIEDRTPYKIADETTADSTLVCRINFDTKRVLTETRTDEPRDLRVTLASEVNWTDRLGNVLMQNRFLPPGETLFIFRNEPISYRKEANRLPPPNNAPSSRWPITLSIRWKLDGRTGLEPNRWMARPESSMGVVVFKLPYALRGLEGVPPFRRFENRMNRKRI